MINRKLRIQKQINKHGVQKDYFCCLRRCCPPSFSWCRSYRGDVGLDGESSRGFHCGWTVVIHWFPLVLSVEGVSTWVVVVSWRVTEDSRLQSWCGPLNVPALSRGFFFSLFHGVLLHEGFLRSYRTIQDLLLKCIFLRNVLRLPLPRTRSPGARVSEAISSEFLPRWSIYSHQGQHVTRPSKTDSL